MQAHADLRRTAVTSDVAGRAKVLCARTKRANKVRGSLLIPKGQRALAVVLSKVVGMVEVRGLCC